MIQQANSSNNPGCLFDELWKVSGGCNDPLAHQQSFPSFNCTYFSIFVVFNSTYFSIEHVRPAINGGKPSKALRKFPHAIHWIDVRRLTITGQGIHIQSNPFESIHC